MPTRVLADLVDLDDVRVIERRRREIGRASRERAREILAWLDRYWFDGAGPSAAAERASLQGLVESRP